MPGRRLAAGSAEDRPCHTSASSNPASPIPDETRFSLEERFTRFLRKLRDPSHKTEDPLDEDKAEVIMRPDAGAGPKQLLTDGDRKRISRRAAFLAARREANSGLAHLRREERDQLKVLSNGAQLIGI